MLASFKTILYATDLSENSTNAFRHAVALAKYCGADIHILHVVEQLSDDVRTTLEMYILNEKQRNDALHNRIETANKRLEDIQERFWMSVADEDRSLRDHIKSIDVVEGYPAEAILNLANESSCDIIVLGGHAQGSNHSFLGSVAKRVMRRARIPALIVPARS